MSDYTQIKEQMKQLKQQQLEAAKGFFNQYSKELFDKYPKLNSFGWVQYTPWFNDGDECVFSAHTSEDSLRVNGFSLYNDDEEVSEESDTNPNYFSGYQEHTYEIGEGGRYERVPNPNHNKENKALVSEIVTFLQQFKNGDLKRLFGNHVAVTVNRNGEIGTEEFSHD